MRFLLRSFQLTLPLLLITSCGWRTQSTDANAIRTISIPFAGGDHDGGFTNDLIHDIERSGQLRYVKDDGELSLRVVFLDSKYDNIGIGLFIINFAVGLIRKPERGALATRVALVFA